MKKVTRDMAVAAIRFRLAFIAIAANRASLSQLAEIGREDLNLMLEHGALSVEEKIQRECELSQAVQARLNDLIPPHLRLVHTSPRRAGRPVGRLCGVTK